MSNDSAAIKPVDVNPVVDWQLHDALPKAVRMALTDCDYEYSAEQIRDVLYQIKQAHPFDSHDYHIRLLIKNIAINEYHLKQADREETVALIEAMSREKQERLNAVFLKSSSAATDRATVPGV